jgi:hypothetical protein
MEWLLIQAHAPAAPPRNPLQRAFSSAVRSVVPLTILLHAPPEASSAASEAVGAAAGWDGAEQVRGLRAGISGRARMREARVVGQSGSPSKSSRAASHRAPCATLPVSARSAMRAARNCSIGLRRGGATREGKRRRAGRSLTAKKRDAAGRRRRSWRSWRIRISGGSERRETTLSTSRMSICDTPSISLQDPPLDLQLQRRVLFLMGDFFAAIPSSQLELLLCDRL